LRPLSLNSYSNLGLTAEVSVPMSGLVRLPSKTLREWDIPVQQLSAITGREQMQQIPPLFDRFVGNGEQRWRHVEACVRRLDRWRSDRTTADR
jgi:hypothetical protein